MTGRRVAIIGGSGLYEMEGVEEKEEVEVATPFGDPSDSILLGRLEGRAVAFLPRHGRGHVLSPSRINHRANIYALKALGVEWIISVSAVGSMKEEIEPGQVVIPDQFIDRTARRESSFFGEGIVVHVGNADPVCGSLGAILGDACEKTGARVHRKGTYICIEGPQFSTRAESALYRREGVDVIGMTNMPEAKLAREAEICYATMALPCDYDCWHPRHGDVSVDAVVAVLRANVEMARGAVREALRMIPAVRNCPCPEALRSAILTHPPAIPEKVRKELALLIGKYIRGGTETEGR